jgi:hypothetical protein
MNVSLPPSKNPSCPLSYFPTFRLSITMNLRSVNLGLSTQEITSRNLVVSEP